MANANPTFIIHGAKALYPRINQTYRFDNKAGAKGQTVPCDITEDGAKYEMSLALNKQEAGVLYKAMKVAYEDRSGDDWPSMPASSEVFEKDEDGAYIIKTVLKGMFGKDQVAPPKQYDAANKPLERDFLLTTGSTVNVLVTLVPYNMSTNGVSLRLRQVQVTNLVELQARSAFGVVEGGFTAAQDGFATSLTTVADTAGADEFDDGDAPAPAPKPKGKGGSGGAAAKTEAKSVEDYDTIDDALDNLEFDEAS
jgi:hypothetical protein